MSRLRTDLEGKSTEELFAASLQGQHDDEAPWEAVHVLRLRGTPEVFEIAKRYCAADDPNARARGLEVLAQLGAGKPDQERLFMGDSVSIAICHLRDTSPMVRSAAAWALSHLRTDSALKALVLLQHDPESEVRYAVAACSQLSDYPEGMSVLLLLTEDSDESVRDWATFSVATAGTLSDNNWQYRDSPQIREALKKRLVDPYEEARREAIWGLARRKDRLGLKLLQESLASEDCRDGDVDAAAETLGVSYETPVEELSSGLFNLLS